MDTNWIEYKCKSGETLFIYNKVTGEHKWPTNNDSPDDSCVMIGQPVIYKELHTTSTQTDDDGCNNGCTSMYINTSHLINTTEPSPQQEPNVLDKTGDDIQPGLDNTLDDDQRDEENDNLVFFGEMSNILQERYFNNLVGDQGTEETDNTICNNDRSNKNITQSENESDDLVELTNNNNNVSMNEVLKEKGANYINTLEEQTTEDSSAEPATSAKSEIQNDLKALHEGKKTVKSYYCLRKSKTTSHLTYHIRGHTGELFECSHCGKKYTQKKNLKHHEKTHTGEKTFECSYCKKTFGQKKELTRHERSHLSEEKLLKCPHCEKMNLACHVRTGAGGKTFECSNCKNKFKSKIDLSIVNINYDLSRQERTQSTWKPFECPHCDKRFLSKTELSRHVQKSCTEMRFECSFCQKRFIRRGGLLGHLRRHCKVKPVECPNCETFFRGKHVLSRHRKTPCQEKPFECSHCEKTFARKNDLSLHEIKRHPALKKRFKCSYCKTKFAHKFSLTCHERIHTGEEPFECSHCKMKFSRYNRWKKHMKRHIGECPS